MDLSEVVRRRRMVRTFDQRPVPRTKVDRVLDMGRRGPSAGFAQGLELLVLDTPETIADFWRITRDPGSGWDPARVSVGPTVLVLPVPDPGRYIDRYSMGDKAGLGLDEEASWQVPYWDLDAAMAVMLMLLAAVEEGLDALFFAISHGERELMERFGVPAKLRPIGVLGLGFRSSREVPTGSWTRVGRRSFGEQVHRNRW